MQACSGVAVQVLHHFADDDRVRDECLKLLLCEIIEQLGQNNGKICMKGLRLGW